MRKIVESLSRPCIHAQRSIYFIPNYGIIQPQCIVNQQNFQRRHQSTTNSQNDDNNSSSSQPLDQGLKDLLDASPDLKHGPTLKTSTHGSRLSSTQAQNTRQTPQSRIHSSTSTSSSSSNRSYSLPPISSSKNSGGNLSAESTRSTSVMSNLLNDFQKVHISNVPPLSTRLDVNFMDESLDVSGSVDPHGRLRALRTSVKKMDVLPLPLPIRLGPTIGRTIRVDPDRSIDVARAFKLLDMLVKRNNIKVDERRQKFHERTGIKKKRLKSERWRRSFKDGFRGMIEKVMKMKRQGW